MCGIIGFLDKTNGSAHRHLGRILLDELQALACRGPDSAGVAMFGPPGDSRYAVRVKLSDHGDIAPRAGRLAALLETSEVSSREFSTVAAYARFVVDGGIDLGELVASIECLDEEIEVVSVGRQLDIVKQVGSPANLEETYGISRARGTHGIGHTRLSTESRVDLSHSQPFWSHGHPDVAIVHNGHITNYHQLRRRYEQRGVRFYTGSDSEVVAIYLGDQLGPGPQSRRGAAGHRW